MEGYLYYEDIDDGYFIVVTVYVLYVRVMRDFSYLEVGPHVFFRVRDEVQRPRFVSGPTSLSELFRFAVR